MKKALEVKKDCCSGWGYRYGLENRKTVFSENTLYLIKNLMDENLTEKVLKKVYPYKVKFVSLEQWSEAFLNKTEGILLIDGISLSTFNSCPTIRRASDGMLIHSSGIWEKNKMGIVFFKWMSRKNMF